MVHASEKFVHRVPQTKNIAWALPAENAFLCLYDRHENSTDVKPV